MFSSEYFFAALIDGLDKNRLKKINQAQRGGRHESAYTPPGKIKTGSAKLIS